MAVLVPQTTESYLLAGALQPVSDFYKLLLTNLIQLKTVKKLFTFLAAFFVASVSFAQIPNAGFETWQTKTGLGFNGPYTYEVPQNWQLGMISDMLATFGMAPNVGKSPIAQTGSFSLKLSSNADSIGADLMSVIQMQPNARPDALIGSFRTSGLVTDPNDYGHALVILTKWNGTSRDTIGFGSAELDSSPSAFKQFTAPITYKNGINPDTAIAYLLYFPEEANTQVMVDNISFMFLLGTKEDKALTQLNFFPNPTSDNATLTFNAATAEKGTLIIRDLTGKEVKNQALGMLQAGANSIPVQTSDLQAGMYIATLQTSKSTQTLRFVKR